MKFNLEKIIISIGIPLLLGSLSSLVSGNNIVSFEPLNKPLLSPPSWLFPIAWTILYILMGIASYLVFTSNANKKEIQKALTLYSVQLILNFFWSPLFFVGEFYLFSFLWLVLLWFFILLTIQAFSEISKPAAYLMIPYLLWVTFAGYLNLMIYYLNR